MGPSAPTLSGFHSRVFLFSLGAAGLLAVALVGFPIPEPTASALGHEVPSAPSAVRSSRADTLIGFSHGTVSLADIDTDGQLDVLLTGYDETAPFEPTTRLYLGDGTGGFTEHDAGLAGVSGGSVSVGDVNSDGTPDLVLTGWAHPEGDLTGHASTTLYLGDGRGGFTVQETGLFDVDDSSSSLADVDRDGDLDLLITGHESHDSPRSSSGSPTATLYLGDGRGSFTDAKAGLTGVHWDPSSAFVDVDTNGTLDLLLVGEENDSQIATTAFDGASLLYLGDGKGGFTEHDAGLKGSRWTSLSVGDVDANGIPDFLITGFDAEGRPSTRLYLGDGHGGFSEGDTELTGVADGSSSLGDVNNDGALDLVITGAKVATAVHVLRKEGVIRMFERLFTGYYPTGDLTATLYMGDGKGRFKRLEADLTGVQHGASAFGDVNSDGHLDLVISGRDPNNDRIATLYVGDGEGGFTTVE